MPGMTVCNRRWAIATDDFLFVGVVDAVFFAAWFCWTTIIFTEYWANSCVCPTEAWCSLLQVFLAGSCCLFALNTLLAISFIVFSTRGTISEPGCRRHVPKLVQIKIVLSFFDFCWAVVGSVHFSKDYSCGHFNVQYNVRAITICLWFMFVARLGLIWLFYDPRGKLKKSNKLRKTIPSEHLSPPVPSGASKKWRHRFQAFCLWFTAPSEDRRVAISTVSELLAFLSYDLDLVASDLIAGLVLYRHKSLKQYQSEPKDVKSFPRISLPDGTAIQRFPTADMPQWMNLKLASRFFSVGMGVFGWPWTLYQDLSCGLCKMFSNCVCCLVCRRQSSNVKGDNCCGCNLAGLLTTSEFSYQDLVHVSFVNRVYQIPFFVAVDHSTSSVILTARGTMSCSDALTDLAAAFEPIDECGLPKDTLCHGGLLMAARRIKAKLEEKRILEKAFTGNESYRLVVTGHSLGAGVASLLALIFRSTYSDLRCFAFAPPPVISEVALPQTFDCVFTVIYGNDVVPYLNYWNIRNIIVDVVDLLNECKLPKHKVLLGCQYENDAEQMNPANSDVESKVDSSSPVLDTKIAENAENCNLQEESNGCANEPESRTRFFVPGRILHIKHSKKYGYRLRICNATEFQPLACKRQMIAHHFPQYMEISLKSLGANDVMLSEQLCSESDSATTLVELESSRPMPTDSERSS